MSEGSEASPASPGDCGLRPALLIPGLATPGASQTRRVRLILTLGVGCTEPALTSLCYPGSPRPKAPTLQPGVCEWYWPAPL